MGLFHNSYNSDYGNQNLPHYDITFGQSKKFGISNTGILKVFMICVF